jgi:site-specific DNA-cytosine methylase
MRVFDFFSGVGGYTCGALQALADASDECDRYEITAVDCEMPVLAALGANVRAHAPGAGYAQRNVRLGTDTFELPDDDGATIVHFSPPCQAFSTARRATPPSERELCDATRLVRWSLDAVVAKRYKRWSFENVPTEAVRRILAEYRDAHPELVNFDEFDAKFYGCPSDRKRLIAGTPAVIRRLRDLAGAETSIRDAFRSAGMAPPANYCSNGNKNGGKLIARGVGQVAHTVTASHHLVFCDAQGQAVRCVTASESAILVGFPASWKLPSGSKVAQRAAGNAISPCLSKVIVRVLLEMPIDAVLPRPTASGGDGGSRTELEELRADVQELWAMVRAQKRKLDALCA